jgi:hypothetical protein
MKHCSKNKRPLLYHTKAVQLKFFSLFLTTVQAFLLFASTAEAACSALALGKLLNHIKLRL